MLEKAFNDVYTKFKLQRLGIIKLTLASALDFAYLCPRNI